MRYPINQGHGHHTKTGPQLIRRSAHRSLPGGVLPDDEHLALGLQLGVRDNVVVELPEHELFLEWPQLFPGRVDGLLRHLPFRAARGLTRSRAARCTTHFNGMAADASESLGGIVCRTRRTLREDSIAALIGRATTGRVASCLLALAGRPSVRTLAGLR